MTNFSTLSYFNEANYPKEKVKESTKKLICNRCKESVQKLTRFVQYTSNDAQYIYWCDSCIGEFKEEK